MVSRSGIARHHKVDGCRKEVGMSAVRGQNWGPCGGLDGSVSRVHHFRNPGRDPVLEAERT